eukprot:PITA_12579
MLYSQLSQTLRDEEDTIKEAATNHFKNLLTEDKSEEDYSALLQQIAKEVTQETNSRLVREVEEEEVQKSIWSLHPDKAPGPDGFLISFYREYWQMIKKDLLKMIRWVLRKGKLGGFANSTYLALIPKENRPSTFSRFRPISLCNSAYKIITKILSSRLKPHLPSLISENQGGFLPNRHITDSILLAQEAIHSSISRKEKGFVLELDLANAFDRVRSTFLFAVLHKMGFDPSFINMIKACISNPWISPLINGRPCAAFQSSRGLRQGCPLSPYLFILMAESLSKALDFNRRTGMITGIKIEQGIKNINHSQFADDTLLMGGASINIARRFKNILDQFMDYSGGKVNQVKSCIYGWNVSNLTIHSIDSELGVSYKLNWSHFTYLGMLVSMGPLKADTWNEILNKIQQWGSMWLNLAGHLVLLKSGLTSLPIYRFSLHQAPMTFHQKMERVLRHFLWQGGKTENFFFNLVSWKSVIQPNEKGGLGIRSPKMLNLALGAKIIWRLISGAIAWWKTALEAKYLSSSRHQLLDTNIPNRESTKIWKLCKKAIPFMTQNISKVPGEGSSIKISTDRILGQTPIGSNAEVTPAISWLTDNGIWSLAQISQWESHSQAWADWKFPSYPRELEPSIATLKNHLHSKAPTQRGKCPNCCQAEETIQHLFIDCRIADDCWKQMALTGGVTWEPKATIADTVYNWRKHCPWKETQSKLMQRIWNAMPLTLVWRIWLARNKKVFQDKGCNTRIMCHKAKNLAVEAIIAHTQGKIEVTNYSIEERNLIIYAQGNTLNTQATKQGNPQLKETSSAWKLRYKEKEFALWLSNCNKLYMFFDGASKSNPRLAGTGVLICNANGETILQFEWGLGELSNHRAEGLALYQGLSQLIKIGIKKVMVFGDSAIIIRLMVQKKSTPNILLQQINSRNQILHELLEEVHYFHILHGLNKKANQCANKACDRPKGNLSCNNSSSFQPLP